MPLKWSLLIVLAAVVFVAAGAAVVGLLYGIGFLYRAARRRWRATSVRVDRDVAALRALPRRDQQTRRTEPDAIDALIAADLAHGARTQANPVDIFAEDVERADFERWGSATRPTPGTYPPHVPTPPADFLRPFPRQRDGGDL